MRWGLLKGNTIGAAALASILLAAPSAANDDVAMPAAGKAAETVLALLGYNRDLCDGIAGRLVSHWHGLGSKPAAQLENVRQLVVERELSNLASARAASDLVERFLPRVREEAGSETGATLERLQALEVELCDTVAYPDRGLEGFEVELAELLDRIEREEAELGRLLVVPEEESALGPYLGHVQMAGVEAEGEYRDHLDSLKPPPTMPTIEDFMNHWHHGYSQAVLPTKKTLARYLQARKANDASQIRIACREILAAVIPLLRNDQVFESPDPRITKPLRQAFREIKQMATECTAGRSRETETHYRKMQTELAAASALLTEYSLRP